jgi:hypothetical protein
MSAKVRSTYSLDSELTDPLDDEEELGRYHLARGDRELATLWARAAGEWPADVPAVRCAVLTTGRLG